MKNSLYILITLCFFCCYSNKPTLDQSLDKKNKFINIDYIELSTENDKVDFKIIVKIPTYKLVFNKINNGFNTSITFDAIFTSENSKVYSESWTESISIPYFEDTKSKKNIIVNKVINLPIGRYDVDLLINDYKNDIAWHKKSVVKFSKNFKMSDIMLYKKNNNNYNLISDEDIANLDTLWVQYQFNNLDNFNSSMIIHYNYFYIDEFDNNSDILNNVYIDKEMLYKNSSKILIDKNGINYFPIEIIDDFFNGIEIKITYNDNYRDKTVLINRYKSKKYDYSKITGPMEYILENSNFKEYRDYVKLDQNKKIDYIKIYWDLENKNNESSLEIFKELYNRVEYVNKEFGYLNNDGWRTDRGKIYIIYGKPFEINEEYTSDAEYQIWVYKNNRKFTFMNRYGSYILIDSN